MTQFGYTKKFLNTISSALVLGSVTMMSIAPAAAQLAIRTQSSDIVTGLSPGDWEALIGKIVNGQALVGDPGILVVSSLPVPITVTCDKWELVGQNVDKSVRGNPSELKPFSVTYIKTKDFDGYCKNSIVGHYGLGRSVIGKLTSVDGSFTKATLVLFSGDKTAGQ